MFSKKDLVDLEKDKSLRAPVLSLYLNLDKKTPEGRHYLAELRRNLLIADEQIFTRYKKPDLLQDALQKDIVPKILNFLDQELSANPKTRAIAVFASLKKIKKKEKRRILSCTLPEPVRSQTHVETTAFVRPLIFLLDQHEPYAIISANHHVANLILVSLGQINKNEEFKSDIPKRNDQGGWSQKRFERKAQNAIEKHAQRLTKSAIKVLDQTGIGRIVLVGDSEMVYLLKKNLPERHLKKIIGTIPSNPHETISETIARTSEVAREAEKISEQLAVQDLQNALAHVDKGVSGLDDVLKAIDDKKVAKLILLNDFHPKGSLCHNCHMLFSPVTHCPNCNLLTSHVDDLGEEMAERVFADGGEVEFVMNSLDLEALGGVGAILRY